ncbi:hypothetical protein BGZ96_003719 [Linnemannia gamsii]|uniref:Uncharacterized protein n=1 Tax=Linnemannia gamsii TaxID=64522 RepID=A0ABQ7JIZ4_9FUNG|nr:hypothetical protein BGZ96_003719 [Linnemannia gamsii]
MTRHRTNNQQKIRHLPQLQSSRISMNTTHAARQNMNNIHEDELADGRNIVQGMLAQIKNLYKDVIKLTEERNQLRIENAVLGKKNTDLKRQVSNFQELKEHHEKAEEDKRTVARVQSGLRMLDLGLGKNSQ